VCVAAKPYAPKADGRIALLKTLLGRFTVGRSTPYPPNLYTGPGPVSPMGFDSIRPSVGAHCRAEPLSSAD
jgi:hypothetical protein